MELLKLLSLNEVIVQILSFLLLLLVLRKFAWCRILGFLDKRKERIAAELSSIEQSKKDVALVRADYERKLGDIENTARQKIHEAMAESRKISDDARKLAHQEAQAIIDNAKENIRHELGKAKEELKARMVNLTMAATEKMIQEKMTEEQDRKLVIDFLERIDEVV